MNCEKYVGTNAALGIAAVTVMAAHAFSYMLKAPDTTLQLKYLWDDLRSDTPEDLLADGARLELRLQDHDRLAAAYQAAGGMDKYYAQQGYRDGGLDQAFHQARSAPASRNTVGGLPQAFLGASSARPRGAIIPLGHL